MANGRGRDAEGGESGLLSRIATIEGPSASGHGVDGTQPA
jgi:hypothetical protein